MTNRRRIEKWLRHIEYENLSYSRRTGRWSVVLIYYKGGEKRKIRILGHKPLDLAFDGREKMRHYIGITTVSQYNEERDKYHAK